MSAVINSELIDPDQGVFSVLGLVTFSLPEPYCWQSYHIEEEMAQGSYFGAFEPGDVKDGGLDVASITVVDVTNDPTEPDVSNLEQADIPSVMVTAITNSGEAVHSRNGIISKELVPSQFYGKCSRQ